ncbi:MAG: signal peptidase I, partial [Opitutaceae bacterium]|nr:signal peptidase I [Opitutaceae bacterium]
MFGLFASQEKKMRSHAANWLELAEKVHHFRRDVLPPNEVAEIQARSAQLKSELKDGSDSAKLKLSIEALELVLRRTGGKVYPKSSLVENVEFFLVAAIVILGIRTYFVQPFKIPTNSMWPSYYGMTPEVFKAKAEEPGALAQAARFVAFGARAKRLDAPQDGEVLIPVATINGHESLLVRIVPGRSWLVFPAKLKEYVLYVNDAPVTVTVPLDFDFEWALMESYFPKSNKLKEAIKSSMRKNQFVVREISFAGQRHSMTFLRTGRQVKAGERILSFDLMTGDQLFVDRMSYHFIQPKVGSGFVFRTGNISGIGGDQYYIKRLVGVPGDTLEIVKGDLKSKDNLDRLAPDDFSGVLMRNGKPISGADAFAKNNNREGLYRGYTAIESMTFGRTIEVPEHQYFALG